MRRRILLVAGGLVLAASFSGKLLARDETRIASVGGQSFHQRVELDVPVFAQNDSRWKKVYLGRSRNTLGVEGCAVTAAAMVTRFYGVRTDPKRLNAFLTETGGLDRAGLISWDRVPRIAPGRLELAYNGGASYKIIDRNLLAGNPVIAVIPLRHGAVHFVVIVGKEGRSYLIRDPMAAAKTYPLRQRTPWICGVISFARLDG